MSKDKTITVRLTEQERTKLKKVAEREGKTVSDIVRSTVINSLKYQF